MQTCDTLLHAGVLLTQDDDRRVLENAALAIDGGRIVALGYSQDVTAAWQAREILDLSGMLVMPGLVNAHTHAAMTFLRGLADDMPLMDWLQQKIFPVEQGLTPDLVRLGSLLGFAEMLRTGTTSCVDMYIFEATVLEAADKAGLRCLAGEGVFNFPSACCPDADAALACTREMAQRWAGHDRLHVAVMPHSVYTTTAAQLTACRELADELGLPLHIHLAETRQETALSLEQHGLRPVAHADRLGLLRPGTILAHVVDVDADEIALLARRGVIVVHNPSSNMKLASGVAPVPAMLDAGVRLALGSDGAASNNRLNMFTEMGRAALLHKAAGDPETMPARTVLDMATRGGAAAMGGDGGVLAVGRPADCIALDLSAPNMQPLFNAASHAVYAATGMEVALTMVAGEVLYRDGRFSRFDYPALCAEVREMRRFVLRRLGLPEQVA